VPLVIIRILKKECVLRILDHPVYKLEIALDANYIFYSVYTCKNLVCMLLKVHMHLFVPVSRVEAPESYTHCFSETRLTNVQEKSQEISFNCSLMNSTPDTRRHIYTEVDIQNRRIPTFLLRFARQSQFGLNTRAGIPTPERMARRTHCGICHLLV
jgi:hypothetical protein